MNILSGTHIQLRGRNGRCISVAHKDNGDRFLAVAEGYCVGGEAESLSLRNRHAKPGAAGLEDIQIRYGDRVVVKARAAREKYLTVPQMGLSCATLLWFTSSKLVRRGHEKCECRMYMYMHMQITKLKTYILLSCQDMFLRFSLFFHAK